MERLLNVLILEDSVADAEINVISLESSGLAVQAKRVETELEYRAALREQPDVVLADYSLPSFDARHALKILREQEGSDIPFIVVSGRIGEAAAVEMMKAGANDYVRKDNLERLAPAVRREVAAAGDRRRSREAALKLTRQEGSLDTLMHNLPGMVYRLRSDGGKWRFEFVSDGCRDLTGYEREALLADDGFDFTKLIHDSADPTRQGDLQEMMGSEGHFTLEHQIRCANGDVKWVWHRGVANRDRTGRLLYVDGFLADVTTQKVNQAKIDYLAHHDVLTGLANRTVFEEELARCLERVKRHFQTVTLLFVDLDDFKAINDTLGHQSGDTVLRAIAGRLTACSRKSDVIARLGGDEFALVMDDNEKTEDIAQTVPRILEEVARPIRIQGREVSVTASIGIAVYPVDGEDVTALLRSADSAMYAAKESGRNTFRFFARKMNERAKSMAVMRNALQTALDQEDFELHYQPMARLSDRHVIGVEALMRWRRGPGRLLTADHFIPFAADAGLITDLDRWAVHVACRQAREWHDRGIPFMSIACNLSTQTLSDPEFLSVLQADMAQYDVAPGWIEIEVTEATLMQNMIATRVTLEKIADIGIRLTLDGFGSGYSSLNNLTRFPLARLKMHPRLIKGVPWQDEEVHLCRGVLALAESLRLETVAVGVENREQAVFLHHAGCRIAQGHLLSWALPEEDCATWLREGRVQEGTFAVKDEEVRIPEQRRD